MSSQTELFLFAASRAQLVSEVIRPALEQGNTVVCDRFAYSTLIYQGYGRGLDLADVEVINNVATQNLRPHLIVLLDLPPEQGLARKRSAKDRFELEDLPFHHRVREGYLKAAAAEPDHWLVIDATFPRAKISRIVWDRVKQLLFHQPALPGA